MTFGKNGKVLIYSSLIIKYHEKMAEKQKAGFIQIVKTKMYQNICSVKFTVDKKVSKSN